MKLIDFINTQNENTLRFNSETQEEINEIVDSANAIGLEVHFIKNRRGRPKASNEIKEIKEKKRVGRPKIEKPIIEKVLKKRGRKPIPKPETKELKKRGRKPGPLVNKEIDIKKQKENLIKKITAIANFIDKFDEDYL